MMIKKRKYCIKSGKKCKKLNHSQIRKLCCKCGARQKPIITIIMGAGAAKIWDGPLSNEINTLFENDKTFTNTEGTAIGKLVFEKLRDHYGSVSTVNFETFINLLEQVFDFVISSTNEGGTDPINTSLLPIIFKDSEFIDSLYNEEIARRLDPISADNHILRRVYFGEMIKRFLRIVRDRIDVYENRVDHENMTDPNEQINSHLFEWLSWLSKRYSVRLYTTNYDRIIPGLLEQKQVSYFDGFFKDTERGKSNPNIKKICNNSNTFIYYQLHGSIHWEPVDSDFTTLDFKLCRDTIPDLTKLLHIENQPGQILLKSGIVAGYSKPQRLMLSPLNAMYSSFIHDCHRSSVICSVGFSFGDPHLTKAIISSLDTTKTKFVDINRECNLQEMEDIFNTGIYDTLSRCLGIIFNSLENRMDEHLIVNDDRFYAYHGGFKNFLERRDWVKLGM